MYNIQSNVSIYIYIYKASICSDIIEHCQIWGVIYYSSTLLLVNSCFSKTSIIIFPGKWQTKQQQKKKKRKEHKFMSVGCMGVVLKKTFLCIICNTHTSTSTPVYLRVYIPFCGIGLFFVKFRFPFFCHVFFQCPTFF